MPVVLNKRTTGKGLVLAIFKVFSLIVLTESFLELDFLDMFALCETDLEDSFDSRNFSVRGLSPVEYPKVLFWFHSCF